MKKNCDHTSVGIIVRNGSNVLLIERRQPPFGFAPPAGHVDDHGSFEEAAIVELAEEVGLTAEGLVLVHEEKIGNPCRREGGCWHHWKIFEAQVSGALSLSPREVRSAIWASKELLRHLSDRASAYLSGQIDDREWKDSPGLEPVWGYIFKQLEKKEG